MIKIEVKILFADYKPIKDYVPKSAAVTLHEAGAHMCPQFSLVSASRVET